jgi:hypothetical protein
VQAAGGQALVCGALSPFADHVFTTREWALGSPAAMTDADWEPVAASLGVDRAHLVRVHQVHGASVVVRRVGDGPLPESRPDADVIVSNDPSLALAIQAADCVPLLVVDRATGVVAAAHAGWRGLAAGVPGVIIAALAREFGGRPADLVAVAGPSVGACCYEVGADVLDAFRRGGFEEAVLRRWFLQTPRPTDRNPSMPGLPDARRADRWFFDGWAATRHQLEAAGVPAGQIYSAGLCTASHPDAWCSYRRDGRAAGRIAGAIRCATPRP